MSEEQELENLKVYAVYWTFLSILSLRWVKYKVNGVRGFGICEWNYQHKGGRPEEVGAKDPEWAAKYRPQYMAAWPSVAWLVTLELAEVKDNMWKVDKLELVEVDRGGSACWGRVKG